MTSVEFVEKVLIGSLLNDSARRAEVPWLGVEDFTSPLCRAIWHHLESGNPPHCQPLVDLVEMSEVLGRDHDLHAHLRHPAELATLQFQAPENPAVLDYGRILVEAAIRREVAAMGLRLESLVTGEPEQIIEEVAHALTCLESMDQRWQVSTGHHMQVDVSAPVGAEEGSRTSGSGNESAANPGSGMDHQMAENAVIGAAVHDWPPGARAHVQENVRASDFLNARAAATWQAVEHLAAHHAHIDEITVAWQAVRASNRSGDGLTVQELRETRGAALFHEVGVSTLARSTFTRVTSCAQATTSRCAEDLGIDLATVIDSVATQHVAVAVSAQRMTGERFPNESLAEIKKRLHNRARRSPVQSVTTRAIGKHQASYHA